MMSSPEGGGVGPRREEKGSVMCICTNSSLNQQFYD